MPQPAPYPDPPMGVFDAAPYRAYAPGPAMLTAPVKALPPAVPPRRILVVGLTAVGDVLHFLPVAVALRRAYSQAEIDWVVQDKARGIVEGRKDLAKVFVFERTRWGRGLLNPARCVTTLREILAFIRDLRSRRYDLLVDPQGTVKSGLVNLASGAPVRIGFARGFGRELNHLTLTAGVALPTRRMHRVRKSLALLEAAGIAVDEPLARVEVASQDLAAADARLQAQGLAGARMLVMHPGTSAFGARKRWPLERFGALADRAHTELGLVPVFILGPIERGWKDALLSSVRTAPRHVLEPASLGELAGLLSRAACFLGSDSAPLHLASNLRVPVVGLYGPTDPVLFAPYYPPAVVVVQGLPCPRCGAPHCNHPVPRMEAMTVDMALEGLRLLRRLTPA